MSISTHLFRPWGWVLAIVMACGAILFAADSDDRTFTAGDARILVHLDTNLTQKPDDVMHWIHQATDAVTAYYGHFPVPEVQIIVSPRRGNPVNSGNERNGRRISIHLDPGATSLDLNSDWMMTHELFHLGFPSVDDEYHYMEEGLSDYLEPLARARIGNLDEKDVWRGFVEGMPQGLAKKGDGGLDGTSDWGRTYWGGCIFWLMVDLDIREQSKNVKSLDDAIRAIVAAGGTGDHHWPLAKVIEVGDAATGTGSIKKIHDQLGAKAVDPNLDAIWKSLGVKKDGGKITFDESAPQAKIRRSMTTAPSAF